MVTPWGRLFATTFGTTGEFFKEKGVPEGLSVESKELEKTKVAIPIHPLPVEFQYSVVLVW